MKWIKVSERLPESSELEVLALCENNIYPGYFTASESWYVNPDGSKKDYKKHISFNVSLYIDDRECDHENHCIDCCEEDYAIRLRLLSFKINKVTHWMQLPEPPKDNE